MASSLHVWLLCLTLHDGLFSDLPRADFQFEVENCHSSDHDNCHADAPVAAPTIDLVVAQASPNLCMLVVGPPVPSPLGEPSCPSAPNNLHATGIGNCLLMLFPLATALCCPFASHLGLIFKIFTCGKTDRSRGDAEKLGDS